MSDIFLNEVIKVPSFRRRIKLLAIDELHVYSLTI